MELTKTKLTDAEVVRVLAKLSEEEQGLLPQSLWGAWEAKPRHSVSYTTWILTLPVRDLARAIAEVISK
jgi:hypothetical protein